MVGAGLAPPWDPLYGAPQRLQFAPVGPAPPWHLLFLLSSVDYLPGLRQLAHGSQATSTDIDGAFNAIDFHVVALDIQHKAAARALLRERHIIAMHRLAFAYFTTTSHITFPLYTFWA